jgi:dihydroxynaphthoic acid synthetase
MAKKPAAKKHSTTKRQYDDILYEVKDQVAWATINRPRVLNAFREQTLDELIDALKSTREDPSIACAVVTGAGDKAFSAGGDFYAMKRLTFVNGAMWNDRMQGLAMTIRGLPIPVIAMVNGWCMGGGHELALWCDLVIASENAVLGQTGARVGACPTVGATQYLPRIIGERLAREMIFCARRFSAKEAVEIGLINKCVPQSELRKETLAWCETIKGHSPQTLRMTKKSLNFDPICFMPRGSMAWSCSPMSGARRKVSKAWTPFSRDANPTSRNSACATSARSKTISKAAPRTSTRRPRCAGNNPGTNP